MEDFTVTIEDGYLVFKQKINTPLVPSSTGKTLLLVSTGGAQKTRLKVDGQTVQVNVNAYISNPAFKG